MKATARVRIRVRVVVRARVRVVLKIEPVAIIADSHSIKIFSLYC